MIPFQIDITETVGEFHLQREEVASLSNYLLDRIVDEYIKNWLDLIGQGLSSTREEYKRAIYTERPDDFSAIIGLSARDSRLPMMIEVGADAFDEKMGFANSEKKQFNSKGKWFLTIPFRHATSEAIMEMEVPGMGISVIDLMKQGVTIGRDELPQPYDEILTHQLKLNTGTLIKYTHKAPIFEGLHRRDIRSTVNEKRGGYFTFRRVSENSDPESWIHPGFTPHLFMDKALRLMETSQVVDASVQEWLDAKFE